MDKQGLALVFSAPSGAGKTTVITRLRAEFPQLAFSVSACSRKPREGEVEGQSYYFLSPEQFLAKVEDGEFLEWEQVYEGMYYGTLHAELQRLWNEGKIVIFDVDVKGAMNIKRALGNRALTVFVAPPSLDALQQRLEARGTETPESLAKRVARAELELGYADRFDRVVVNDDLDLAVAEAVGIARDFLAEQ